ncbi:MAG TPA: TatD family hydrolase [Bacteroidales bacterium]|nr:TatD family hydrolase [Bacteroidales bacterium]
MYTDTHTHIYSEEFDSDRLPVIRRAVENGVTRMYLPAIDSGWHEKMLDLCRAYPENCFPMMGLHPTSVKQDYRDELAIAEAFLADAGMKFYAIGEVGIDLYWDKTYEAEQRIVFGFHLDLALRHNLPLVIHTRNSMDMALQMIEERHEPRLRGVFHCFSGNRTQAERAIALGFLLGIGGVVTYKNSGLQAVVEHTGLDHLLLETDAPWLPPVPHRGQRNEPSYLPLIAQKISEIKGVPIEKVAETTTRNAERLFGS